MILPKPQAKYEEGFFARVFSILKLADDKSLKRDQDVEIGVNRLILTSPDGNRWVVVVDNLGLLTTTAL